MSKWSSKQILSFLEVYETYEVLWNIESHLYRDRTARDDAIKKLLCELNIEGLTVEDLRRKIKMIKTVYSAELNKIIKSQKNEERNAVVYTPKLSWFQKADSFLRNVTATKSPTTIESFKHNILLARGEMNKKSDRFNKKIKYERKMNLASKSFLKTSESNSVNVVEKKAVNSLKSIADSTVTQQEDELDHFGKYIIAMLRQLPPLNALICQQEIQNILTRERIAVMERTQNSLSPVRINDRSPSPSTSHFSTDVSELTSPGSTFQGGIVKDEEIIM